MTMVATLSMGWFTVSEVYLVAFSSAKSIFSAYVTPFRVFVSTAKITQASIAGTEDPAVGFNLMYQQMPCVANLRSSL